MRDHIQHHAHEQTGGAGHGIIPIHKSALDRALEQFGCDQKPQPEEQGIHGPFGPIPAVWKTFPNGTRQGKGENPKESEIARGSPEC